MGDANDVRAIKAARGHPLHSGAEGGGTEGGWKKHGNRISSGDSARRESEGAGSFLPAPRRHSLRRPPSYPDPFASAVLTASLIKSLREARKRSRFLLPSHLFFSHPRVGKRPWPLRGAEIAVLRLAREDKLDSLVNHSPFDDVVCACYPLSELGKRDFQRRSLYLSAIYTFQVDRLVDTFI